MLPTPPTSSKSTTESLATREKDLQEALSLLRSGLPILAIVGPPGVGKTHLLEELLHHWTHSDGEDAILSLKSFADFDNLDHSRLAPSLIAIDCPEEANNHSRNALAPILRTFPQASLLLTSWRTLSIAGVRNHQLTGLPVDEAMALFRQKVESQGFDIESTIDQLPVLPDVMKLIDGIPAAVVKAADRAPALALDELRDLLKRRPLWLFGRFGDDELITHNVPGFTPHVLHDLPDSHRLILDYATAFPEQFDISAMTALLEAEGLRHTDVIDGVRALIDRCLGFPIRIRRTRTFRLYRSARIALKRQLTHADSERIKARFIHTQRSLAQNLRQARYQRQGASAIRQLVDLLPNLNEALDHLQDKTPQDDAVDLYLSREIALLYRGEATNEIEPFRQAPLIKDRLLRAEWNIYRGRSANRQGNRPAAERLFLEAVNDLRGQTDPRSRWFFGLALLLLSETKRLKGCPDEALQHLDEAESIPHPAIQRAALAYRFATTATLQRSHQAREILDRFYQTSPSDEFYLESHIWQRIGHGCHHLRNHDEESRAYAQAYDYGRKIDDPDLCSIVTQLQGDAAMVASNLPRARRLYEQVLPELQHRQDILRKTALVHNLARVLHRLGELERAYPFYMEALSLAKSCGYDEYLHKTYPFLAILHYERDRFEEALHYFEKSQLHPGSAALPGPISLLRGWLYLHQHKASQARFHFLEAITSFRANSGGAHWIYVAQLSSLLVDKIEGLPLRPDAEHPFDDHKFGQSKLASRIVKYLRGALFDPDFDIEEALDWDSHYYPFTRERALVHLLRSQIFLDLPDSEPLLDEHHPSEPSESHPPPAPPNHPSPLPRFKAITLAIGPEARWFQLDNQSPVDLRRRGAPRLILRALIENHLNHRHDCLSVDALCDIGWPNEALTGKAAADRVYWAIRTLRKLGLEDLLLTTDGGYRIMPEAHIQPLPNTPFPA